MHTKLPQHHFSREGLIFVVCFGNFSFFSHQLQCPNFKTPEDLEFEFKVTINQRGKAHHTQPSHCVVGKVRTIITFVMVRARQSTGVATYAVE